MVDRIMLASTERTATQALNQAGFEDWAAVETEPFTQWVIEDRFVARRPGWEAGGAIFADHARPFEDMKLRMLSGTHSMMAYAGFLSCRTYVRDVMLSKPRKALVARHMAAASATLANIEGMDCGLHVETLVERFGNPAIAPETYQIAMDSSQKMPQRIFAPALDALDRQQDLSAFVFATAIWMRYCLGRRDDGWIYDLRDPLVQAMAAAVGGSVSSAEAHFDALAALAAVMLERLANAFAFRPRSWADWKQYCVLALLLRSKWKRRPQAVDEFIVEDVATCRLRKSTNWSPASDTGPSLMMTRSDCSWSVPSMLRSSR